MPQPRMTMARTIKLYKLPDETSTPGLRPMRPEDVPQVQGSEDSGAGERGAGAAGTAGGVAKRMSLTLPVHVPP